MKDDSTAPSQKSIYIGSMLTKPEKSERKNPKVTNKNRRPQDMKKITLWPHPKTNRKSAILDQTRHSQKYIPWCFGPVFAQFSSKWHQIWSKRTKHDSLHFHRLDFWLDFWCCHGDFFTNFKFLAKWKKISFNLIFFIWKMLIQRLCRFRSWTRWYDFQACNI